MSHRRLSIVATAAALLLAPALPIERTEAQTPECRDQPVVMISTTWCGFCRKARSFFNEHNIEFEEIDAERTPSPGIRETYRRTGVPLIIVGATEVRGFNERRLRQLLCLPG